MFGFLFLFASMLSTHAWMDQVVEYEFTPFEKQGITKELLENSWKHCKRYKEFKRFQVIDSKVYGDECPIKNLLKVLVKQYEVPNVDFIYFNEDRIKPSFFKRSRFKHCAPILVSAKNKSLKKVVLFSDWMYDITDDNSGWNQLIQTVNEHAQIPWGMRKEKLFWRGTPWDGKHFGMYAFDNWKKLPRGKLVASSQLQPDLIDAAFSKYPDKCVAESLEKCEQIFGNLSFVSWADMLKHKYQMAMDGVTCSFPATQWKLLSGAVTFKQETPDIMYFYKELIPWKHYIPVKHDLSDLLEKIKWAKTHDVEAKEIAENGRNFAKENLMPKHILKYCHKVLVKYAALQKFSPEKTLD